MLDDYLAVRPDRAQPLQQLLRDRRLEAGPWFVLADELIPGGEALIRNLLTGRRLLERMGATSPPVLYCPDSFGHPATLPALAAGFGLPMIILWRGFGGARWPHGDIVRWTSPAGETALAYHLPRDGYEFGSELPTDEAAVGTRWQRMKNELGPRSAVGVVLIPSGADHHARQLGLRDAIARLATAARPDTVEASSLHAFAEDVLRAVEVRGPEQLPEIRGELRDSYGYTWTLQGTFATRAHEKRLNARVERLLVREVEPWAALARLRSSSMQPLVHAAWRALLEAHPHDTLCGTSIDAVAVAMEQRLHSARRQGMGVRDDAILRLIGHDPVEARNAKPRWTPVVVVRNATARPRGGIAYVTLEQFLADVPVGPGSAPRPDAPATPTPPHPAIHGVGVIQVLSREIRNALTESPQHYPDNDLVAVTRVAAWVPAIGGYGIVSYALEGAERSGGDGPGFPVSTTDTSLSNGRVTVSVGPDGDVSLEDATTQRRIESLIAFVDDADLGDSYTPSIRPRSYHVAFRGVEREHDGPLVGVLALHFELGSPARRRIDAHITVRLILEADAHWVRVEVDGVNRLKNHRLRLRITGDVSHGETWADAAFGPVFRQPIVVAPEDARTETPPPTAPLHRYVSLFDDMKGITLVSDGLAEYETTRDGALFVTLVRAIGELSRNTVPERPGHAGWPRPTPGAQCLGRFAGKFAVMLHGPRTPRTIHAIEQFGDDVLLPLRGTTLRPALHVASPVDGIELEGMGVAMSAIKESEDGRALILRCVNLLDIPTAGAWRLPFAPARATLVRLDETPIADLTPSSALAFELPAHAVLTIRIES